MTVCGLVGSRFIFVLGIWNHFPLGDIANKWIGQITGPKNNQIAPNNPTICSNVNRNPCACSDSMDTSTTEALLYVSCWCVRLNQDRATSGCGWYTIFVMIRWVDGSICLSRVQPEIPPQSSRPSVLSQLTYNYVGGTVDFLATA